MARPTSPGPCTSASTSATPALTPPPGAPRLAGPAPVRRRTAPAPRRHRPARDGSTSSCSTTPSPRSPPGHHPAGAARRPARRGPGGARSRRIGLVPTVTTTHTEPFHVSKNVATLDLVSGGRAGWRVGGVDHGRGGPALRAQGGAPTAALVRRGRRRHRGRHAALWDSWEDDAVIRDLPTGRYVDRDKLHYVDFEGAFFSVRGPVDHAPLAAGSAARRRRRRPAPTSVGLAARRADIAVRSRPSRRRALERDDGCAPRAAAAGRDPDDVARPGRRARVGEPGPSAPSSTGWRPAPRPPAGPGSTSSARRRGGRRPGGWCGDGAVDGFLVRAPTCCPPTLDWFVDEVVPPAAAARRFRDALRRATLRDRFGPRPPGQPLRRERPSRAMTTAPQADPPRRPLPGRQQHDRVERPDVRQPDRLRLVRPPGPHRRAGQVRLLLPRRGPAPARAPGSHLRPRRRRPARLADRAGRAGRRHRPDRPGRHAQHHVQRALRAGPPVRHARPPLAAGVPRGTR